MAKTPGEMIEAIKKNLPEKSGKSFEQWLAVLKVSGGTTRAEHLALLKDKHGLGHSTASILSREFLNPGFASTYEDGDALVEQQYAGDRSGLRPLYEALLKAGKGLGKDVRAAPCKTYVPLIRNSQFAIIKPTTRSRVDLGLALGKTKPSGRLEKTSSLGSDKITHVIKLESAKEIDPEVKRWLKTAYEQNG
jgi:hypothetical protein